MSSLSIRKLPPDLDKALIREAKNNKTTKTEIVLQALQDRLKLVPQEKRRQKIDRFFGQMTKRQYESFKKTTEDFSKIEEDLWK